MAQYRSVMISSTAVDLRAHRQFLIDSSWRQGFYPLSMEHLPASDADAIAVSLNLVDQADLYLGILGRRYGHVPAGCDISITEMEYRHAVQRGIPCLMFLMHPEHPATVPDADTGERAEKLEALKALVTTRHTVNFFRSAEELRALAINSLSHYRAPAPATLALISEIPSPPEPYIAHPYTLLQTRELVGRRTELDLLTAWASGEREDLSSARTFIILAFGGEGKSALTWYWFTHVAPQTVKPLAGRVWWSFYERDASFENFVTRTLAYVSRLSETAVREIPLSERESKLLAILGQQRYLLVLDGLEHVLNAYVGTNARQLGEDEERSLDGAAGLALVAGEARNRRLRKAADPRLGIFLRKLRSIRSTAVLVSTRLYPAELETVTGELYPEVLSYQLGGLSDEDALALWRAFKVGGSREALLPLFNSFGNHALVLQALASEIAYYRHAPGDFERWRRKHPDFNPFGLPLQKSKTHVLASALAAVESGRRVLSTIAGFRIPITYDSLTALLVGKNKLFPQEATLDAALDELEGRGLLGWDRKGNRYDLHPVVRGVVWTGLPDVSKQTIQQEIAAHLAKLTPREISKVERIEDLTAAIELYKTLIDLKRYDHGYQLMKQSLYGPMLRLGSYPQLVVLLERLFAEGLDQPPPITDLAERANLLFALAVACDLSGQPGRAVPFHQRSYEIYRGIGALRGAVGVIKDLVDTLRLCGRLVEAGTNSQWALEISTRHQDHQNRIYCLYSLGNVFGARGLVKYAKKEFKEALHIAKTIGDSVLEGAVNAHLAQLWLWSGDIRSASLRAKRAFECASKSEERDLIRARRLLGLCALRGQFDSRKGIAAGEHLTEALVRARTTGLIEEELPLLIGIADLRRRQGNLVATRELLEDAWELAERGPYPLFHADAKNLLAQIELEAGNPDATIRAAMEAFRLSWCDGPPHAYHWGLEAAQAHLAALGAPVPTDLQPFNGSRYEPIFYGRPELWAPLKRM